MWQLTSPTARYEISLEDREAFNSHWVHTPSLRDVRSGETLWALSPDWSLDENTWLSESVVKITVRKYPGNHTPPDVVATLDCADRTARVGEAPPTPLPELEASLDRALTWICAKAPEPQPEVGIVEALTRFFRR